MKCRESTKHQSDRKTGWLQAITHAAALGGIIGSCLLWVPSTVAQTVRFLHEPTPVGQHRWQHVTVVANLTTTYEQSGQTISRRQNCVTREQVRRTRVLDASSASCAVLLTYDKAQETRVVPGYPAEVIPQPVAKKTYRVSRHLNDLIVRDEQGQEVSDEEYVIVRENMQALGRPNPIARLLHGRELSVGQTIVLPEDSVVELLGWEGELGNIETVTLTLSGVSGPKDEQIAVCDLDIQGAVVPELDACTKLSGKLEVDPNSCRIMGMNMETDLAVRQRRGPEQHSFHVMREGKVHLYSQMRLLSTTAD